MQTLPRSNSFVKVLYWSSWCAHQLSFGKLLNTTPYFGTRATFYIQMLKRVKCAATSGLISAGLTSSCEL